MKHCFIYEGSIIFARELRRMKRKRRNRIIIAWVLLLTLMPISIVKATHFHDGAMAATCHASASSHSQGSDDGGTCPICHFFLSPFVEAPAILLVPFAQPVYIFIDCPYADVIQRKGPSPSLRAPPYMFV